MVRALLPKLIPAAILLWMVFTSVQADQRCRADAMMSTPTSRFEDNADGTVTDRETKLMWLRCSVGQRWVGKSCSGQSDRIDWRSAQAEVVDMNRRGTYFFSDWRLPQLRELASITERECSDPRINADLFPNTPAASYWTVSMRPDTAAVAPEVVYALSFGTDGVRLVGKEEMHHARLVRRAD